MVVRPMSFPLSMQPVPTPPATNYGQRIAGLFDDYQQGQETRRVRDQQQAMDDLQQEFQSGNMPLSDYSRRLIGIGALPEASQVHGIHHQDRSHDLAQDRFAQTAQHQDRTFGLQQQRLGLQQQRFGLEQEQADQERQRAQQWREMFLGAGAPESAMSGPPQQQAPIQPQGVTMGQPTTPGTSAPSGGLPSPQEATQPAPQAAMPQQPQQPQQAPQATAGGLMDNLTPEQRQALALAGPEQGASILVDRAFEGQFRPLAPEEAQQMGLPDDGSFQVGPDGRIHQIGGQGTTVNVGQSEHGTIPPGYQLNRGEDGSLSMEPIPGGPVEQEMRDAERQRDSKQHNMEIAGGTVVQDAGRALRMIEESPRLTTGPAAQVSSGIAGTPAFQVAEMVKSIGGNVGVDRLQAMREASPTGGALGQVPQRQLQLLMDLLGSTNTAMPADDITANLKRISNIYMDLMHGTPEEIRNLERQGLVPKEQADMLAERYDLPFDYRGRPVEQQDQGIPEGMDPQDWEYMTEEERALFR